MADTGDFSKMKLAEMKQACRERRLPISGTKAELLIRLQGATGIGSATGDDITEQDDSLLNEEEDDDLKAIEAELDKTDDLNLDSTLDKSDDNINIEEKTTTESPEKDAEPKSPTGPHKAISLTGTLTESEKLAIRAKKFGVVSEDAKKQIRAAKFGATAVEAPSTGTTEATADKTSKAVKDGVGIKLDDIDRLKRRAERFGDSVSPAMKKITEKEKQLKRQERFGVTTSENEVTPKKQAKLVDGKKAEREKRFGAPATDNVTADPVPAVDDVRRKRAERFGAATVVIGDLDERKQKRLDRFK